MAEKKEKQYVSDNAQLMAEWDWEKNAEFNPAQLTFGSNKKVWWKCNKGHAWQATINDRNRGRSCPYCSGRNVLKGFNDLQTLNPSLAKEWNYKKNEGVTPDSFTVSSGEKVWWKCSKGHEWQATIANRSKGAGCPFCSGRYAIQGENDLQSINPVLSTEWNYERNGALKPENFTANSSKKVWWICEKGHEWQATIAHRNNGRGCPYCSSRKVLKGFNDLQTINPSLAEEWNYEKNGSLKPEAFAPNSDSHVWWKCSKGHEWQATIANRNKEHGCPWCFGRYAIRGQDDLQTLNPALAEEWNYEKNEGIMPWNVKLGSVKTVWWKCCEGHEWQSAIRNRSRGSICPQCTREKQKRTK